VNQADTLIFQTEKNLKEFGEKLPADKKGPIENALADLKKAHAEKDLNAIKTSMDQLNQVFSAASQDMYNASNASGAEQAPNNGGAADAEVTDVDFEEVKDDKK
jgi:molecular chaperone DnaK